LDLHFLDDGGSVVGDGDFLVGGDHEFVEALGSEGGAEGGGDGFGGEDVSLGEGGGTLMAAMPLILVFVSCSLRMMKGRPYSSKAKLIFNLKIFKIKYS
jgi:hypothetical protein